MEKTVNIKYKDRLFRAYFGAEENRDKLLSLYNALNDSNYEDPTELEINTLDDVIYMKMKNDVSFIVDGYMSLYEHQSTINPNMPFRGLCYFAKMYEKYKAQQHINMFTSSIQKIPTPQYYVFYNGKTEAPDKTILRLSDAFMQPVKEGEFEWTAVMLNVNNGRNNELMDRCRPLAEYALLVDKVREYQASGMEFADAIDAAVTWCIKNDCMVEYLRKHREEVTDMWLTEYNEEEVKEAMRLNGLAEGRAEGLAEGINKGLTQARTQDVDALMTKLNMSLEEACETVEISVEEYQAAKQ